MFQKVIILGDGKLGLTTALALNASNVDILLVGKHQNKLDIAKNQGVKTKLLQDLEVKKEWDFVVEATGSISGFETALNLTKPRGTLVLKSTVAASKEFNLAPIVIDEIRVQGSRCGRFEPALRLLASEKIDFSPFILDLEQKLLLSSPLSSLRKFRSNCSLVTNLPLSQRINSGG